MSVFKKGLEQYNRVYTILTMGSAIWSERALIKIIKRIEVGSYEFIRRKML